MPTLLIVDDDANIRESLRDRFAARGHDVSTAVDGKDALVKIRRDRPDLVLLDLQMPELDGIGVLPKLQQDGIDVTVVVITAFGTVDRAVPAMTNGAYAFIPKPFEPALVEETVKRALERTNLQCENRALRAGPDESGPVAEDPRSKETLELAARAAKSAATVLLLGESGTGKEVLAHEIHRRSPRAAGPFVAVNCVAIPETLLESELFGHEKGAFTGAVARRQGKVELAHRGTLFLDEIGDITPGFQAKLLRVLQERAFERVGGNETIHVDIRVVAATNRDLKAAVSEGKFREDLFYRLNVISIPVPALRERRGDVRPLVQRFVAGAAREAKRPVPAVPDEVMRLLEAQPWPGNVRELKNVVERAVVLLEGDELTAGDLPAEMISAGGGAAPGGFHDQVAEQRKRIVKEALERTGGNQTKAAELLGLQRTYLARLIRQMEI
ncbi:MAG: sigma-54-dependent Fis family transcriptional regulator [Planctomycetia bacterium]|nr:sigma-54-dependent Fis family transcriptional regulator [Planctomycetia bacterium]